MQSLGNFGKAISQKDSQLLMDIFKHWIILSASLLNSRYEKDVEIM